MTIVTLDGDPEGAHTSTMIIRDRFSRRTSLAAVVATGVVGLAALAASPAVAAPTTAPRAASTAGAVSVPAVDTVSNPAGLPALPILVPAVNKATTHVARLGSCSAAMMDL